MTLKSIKGGNSPDSGRDKDYEDIRCPQCGGNIFYPEYHAPKRKRMKWLKRSGEIVLKCVLCKITVARS